MRISSININTVKQVKQQKAPVFLSKINQNFDRISFCSKTPEQLALIQEAKDISKQAYGVVMRSKGIKKEAKTHLEGSTQILYKAKEIQRKAQNDYNEIRFAFDYAEKHKTKAIADPFKNTQVIFSKNFIEEYQDNRLLRRAEKTDKEIILLEYPKSKKVKRSVFDIKTGELIEFSENYKQKSSKNSTSDTRLTFANGKLKTCDFGISKNPKSTMVQKSYAYEDDKLTSFALNFYKNNDRILTLDHEFNFNDGELISFYKEFKSDNSNQKTAKEVYIFSARKMQYLSNFVNYPNNLKTTDKAFYFEDLKLKKAIIGLYDDFSIKTAEKHFVYGENERPKCCYLNPQSANTSVFSDEPMFYGHMVYL